MSKYSRLVVEQADAMDMNAVSIVENDEPYASTDGHSIFVNPQFMSKIDSNAGEGGVRFVIAHELGHIHQGMTAGPASELQCDEFAARSIAATGQDESVIPAVMRELNSEATESHPGSSERQERAMEAHEKEVGKTVGGEMPRPKEKRITRFPRQH
jgi:predicted Zn-dependent protease